VTTWLTYLAAVAEYDRFQDAARKQFLGARKQSHFISTEHKCLANAMPRCPESRNEKSASAMPRCHSISTEHKCLDFNPRSRVSSFNTYQYASRCATTSEYTRLQYVKRIIGSRCSGTLWTPLWLFRLLTALACVPHMYKTSCCRTLAPWILPIVKGLSIVNTFSTIPGQLEFRW
jgi:hypothetical protein